MSFFDNFFQADPQRAAALAGMAQGFGQAGQASYLPMGFGSAIAMGAHGLQQGQDEYLKRQLEQQKLQSGDIGLQESQMGLQAKQAQLANMQRLLGGGNGAPTTPMGFPATRMDAINQAAPQGGTPDQGAANLGTNPAGTPPMGAPTDPLASYFPPGTPPSTLNAARMALGVQDFKTFNDLITKSNEPYTLGRPGAARYSGNTQIASAPTPEQPFNLAPGATRYGADGKAIVTAPEKPALAAIPLPPDVEAQRIRIAKAGIDERAAVQNTPADTTPEQRSSYAAQASTGMPLNQILPGYRGNIIAQRQQIHADAIAKIMTENPGMSAADAGTELANRTIEFQSGKKSAGQLTTMLGATRQAVAQLHFNIDKTKEEMAKLGSSDLSPFINAIARGEEKWTGNPAYSSLFYYMHATAVESARVLSGGQASTAQLHQGAMEEAQKWANINMTPASFNAVGDAMKAEGSNKLQTYQDALRAQRVGDGPAGASNPAQPADAGATKTLNGVTYHKVNGQWMQ